MTYFMNYYFSVIIILVLWPVIYFCTNSLFAAILSRFWFNVCGPGAEPIFFLKFSFCYQPDGNGREQVKALTPMSTGQHPSCWHSSAELPTPDPHFLTKFSSNCEGQLGGTTGDGESEKRVFITNITQNCKTNSFLNGKLKKKCTTNVVKNKGLDTIAKSTWKRKLKLQLNDKQSK